MKNSATKTLGILLVLIGICSCSKSKNSEPKIDTDEYYTDNTGKYLLELGDDGYNIYKDGSAYENSNLTNRVSNTNLTNNFTKTYQYNYKGICILPPQWPRGTNNPLLSGLPVKPKPSKKTITCNLASVGGGYRVTPKPAFLGGSDYPCYECLLNSIDRNDFYIGVCNGSVFISGALSDDPSLQSAKDALLNLNFNPNETDQFVQSLNSTGSYNCTRR
jgi:hypothetical protein